MSKETKRLSALVTQWYNAYEAKRAEVDHLTTVLRRIAECSIDPIARADAKTELVIMGVLSE